MYKNSRIYGLLYAKLKIKPLSVAIYFILLFCFRFIVLIKGLFSSEKVDTSFPEKAVSELDKIYKKPVYDVKSKNNLVPMGKIKISIIIPTYKNADRIPTTIKKVLSQKTSYPYEVILVNDGSPDNTDEVVKQFLDDERFVYINKENGGVSSARNVAIKRAVGEYFMFVDADDEIADTAVENLVNSASETGADIVVGSWQCTDNNGKIVDEYKMQKGLYSYNEFIALREISGVVWGKLFKREFFNDILFPEKYTSFSDTITRCLIFRKAQKIALISDFVYKWTRNEGSITFSSKNSAKTVQSYWIIEDMLRYNDELSLPKDLNFYTIFLSQLSYINVIRLNGMEDNLKKLIFIACCGLYSSFSEKCPYKKLPFALKIAHKTLTKGDFGKWKLIGKYYRFIA